MTVSLPVLTILFAVTMGLLAGSAYMIICKLIKRKLLKIKNKNN